LPITKWSGNPSADSPIVDALPESVPLWWTNTYFQRPACIGVAVLNTASSESGVPTANRLLAAPGASGAGARANSKAQVTVITARSAANTTTLRCDPCCDCCLPTLALLDLRATWIAAGKTFDPSQGFRSDKKTPVPVPNSIHRPSGTEALGKNGRTDCANSAHCPADRQ
jgi:hypothetical protein